MENNYDDLYEALTIEKTFLDAKMPPDGGFNKWFHLWPGYWRWAATSRFPGHDIVYTNQQNERHRIFGPAYISTIYDIEIWYKNNKYHRIGGPAIRHKNSYLWYQDGLLHRTDGPAIINQGGPKEYYIEGRKYSPKEYKKEINRRKRKGLIE